MHEWMGASPLPEKQLDVLEQRNYVQTLFQNQQKAESFPSLMWRLWGDLEQRFQEQQRWLEEQQKEINFLKRQFEEQSHLQTRAAPDAFQRWMSEHRLEVARHRGKHIAVHSREGIIASADSYASLIAEIERRGFSDNDFVIEFISPTFSPK